MTMYLKYSSEGRTILVAFKGNKMTDTSRYAMLNHTKQNYYLYYKYKYVCF